MPSPTPIPTPPYANYQDLLNTLPDAKNGNGSSNTLAIPKTKQEFDALPDGTFYIEPEDGHIYQKGNKQRPRPVQSPHGTLI